MTDQEVPQWDTATELVDRFLPVDVLSGTVGLREATITAVAVRQGATNDIYTGLNAGRQETLLAKGATCSTVVEALNMIGADAEMSFGGKFQRAQRDEWHTVIPAFPVEMLERWQDHRDFIIDAAGYCVSKARQEKAAAKVEPITQEGMF
jgi:hypothetical protein